MTPDRQPAPARVLTPEEEAELIAWLRAIRAVVVEEAILMEERRRATIH